MKLKIAAHPIQQAIIEYVCDKEIDSLSLRKLGNKIGFKNSSPQKIKHHLGQLVKYGFLDIVAGKYVIGKLIKK
jgi:hypothetical protein